VESSNDIAYGSNKLVHRRRRQYILFIRVGPVTWCGRKHHDRRLVPAQLWVLGLAWSQPEVAAHLCQVPRQALEAGVRCEI